MSGFEATASNRGLLCLSSFSCCNESIEDSAADSYCDCGSSRGVSAASKAVAEIEVVIIKGSMEQSTSIAVAISFIVNNSVTIINAALLNFINCK